MKKFFVSTIIFSIILLTFSCINFAANLSSDVKNVTDSIGNAVANTANGAKNVVENTENTLENGANTMVGTTENLTNDAKNMTGYVESSINNMSDDYTAERTSTTSGFMGMSSTAWTWLILGIVGLAIVGLVWYYGSQYEHTDYMDGE